MPEKFDWKGLPGWIILTFASVIGLLFGLWSNAVSDLRIAEKDTQKALTDCEVRVREFRETELAEWKKAFNDLKADQEEKMKQLTKIKKR